MNKKEFIKKAESKHGVGTYGYDKVPDIIGCKDKIYILCHKHGYFLQRASSHYLQGYGCNDCAKEHLWDKRTNERLNTEKFKERALSVWGKKYDYSKSYCESARDIVEIICPKHGAFKKSVSNHLNGQGCPQCSKESFSNKKSIGREEIIRRCKQTHGDKYIYDLVNTDKITDKIYIICPKHGVFEQYAHLHINGSGCPDCGREKTYNKKRLPQTLFVKKATEKHNGYYTYENAVYVSYKNKVIVTCPKHGDFEILAGAHLFGEGCAICAHETNGVRCRNTTEEFVRRAVKIHGNRYVYDKSEYTNLETPIIITCPEHGDFKQTPSSHLKGNGCPWCHRSKGENRIANFLNKNNISFEIEKKISNKNRFCDKKFFLLDFYLPDFNTIIEYNGEQHYRPVEWFGGNENFKKQKRRDIALRVYCKRNKIKLIEIPYWDFNNIEKILKVELKNK